MALALYAQASYGEVLRCLLEGVRWLRLGGLDAMGASKSAITRARIRLGVTPMRELFQRVAHPIADPGTPGAWYRGRRLVSVDGTTIDCRIRRNWRPSSAALPPRGAPAASRSCAWWG
jgi:hypothetical protein